MFGWMLTVYTTMTKPAAEFIDFISQLLLRIGPDNIFDDMKGKGMKGKGKGKSKHEGQQESDDSPDLDLRYLPESDDSYAAWFLDD